MRAWRRTAVFVAVAMLAGGCSAGGGSDAATQPPDGTASADVGEDGGHVEVNGAAATIPAGAVDSAAVLRVAVGGAAPGDPPADADWAGPLVEVTLNAALTRPATLILPIADVGAEELAVAAYWDDDAERWTLAASQREQDSLRVETEHFSLWRAIRINMGAIARRAKDAIANLVTGRAGVTQPVCQGAADVAASGLELRSDSGDTAKWCLGLKDGHPFIRIANNRNAAALVNYPATWTPSSVTGSGLTFESLGRWLDSKAPAPPGYATRVIDGGATIDLDVPAGQGGVASVEMSKLTWAMSNLDIAVDILLTTLATWLEVGGTATEVLIDAIDSTAFFTCFQSHYGGSVDLRQAPGDNEEPIEIVTTAAAFGVDCGWDFITDFVIKVSGRAISRVALAVIGAVVGFVVAGFASVFNAVRGITDIATGKARYMIELLAPIGAATAIDLVRASPQADPTAFHKADWGSGMVDSPSSDEIAFDSPSGNVTCVWGYDDLIEPDLVCDITERTSSPPPPAEGCDETGWAPGYIKLDTSGVRNGFCTGGIQAPLTAAVLGYGQALVYGDYGCLSAEDGVTCVNLSTGRGFTVARARFETF